VQKSKEDALTEMYLNSLRMRATEKEQSRYAFANLTCQASDDQSASTTDPPLSPCFSIGTDIKPEDSRSMCSQALTHVNPMSSWGVPEVAAFFTSVGFGAKAVHDGSVDGETLLQKFEEQDIDFFTLPVPDGLGLTGLQYKGRLCKEMQRWSNTRDHAMEARA
jgi:hypothetical protein